MTSKKFGIALIALFVLSFFVAAPASAAAPVLGDVIATGETVFIGESGLNVTATMSATATKIYHYSGASYPGSGSPDAVVDITDNTSVYISLADFGGYTGAWFNDTVTGTPASFYVQEPSIGITLWNVDTEKEVSDGVAVEDSNIAVRLDTNLGAIFTRASAAAVRSATTGIGDGVDVYVTTPAGATLVSLYPTAGTAGPVVNTTGAQPDSSLYFLPVGGTLAASTAWNLDIDNYAAGTYSAYAECNINSLKDNRGAITGKTISATHTLTIDKEAVSIVADKETVVRNNGFAVTVSGKPNTYYYVWVSGTNSYTGTELPPQFMANQDSVVFLNESADPTIGPIWAGLNISTTPGISSSTANWFDNNGINYSFKSSAKIYSDVPTAATMIGANNVYSVLAKTGSSGDATIGLTTATTTKAATFTIRAQDMTSSQLYDTCKIAVEKGAVTITASGDGSYYLGEEVILSGTDTDTNDVYLYITGPNLDSNGVGLVNTSALASAYNAAVAPFDEGMIHETVKTDDTWQYKWDTSGSTLDAGTYTIYAVATASAKNALAGSKYDTVSIVVKKPFVTATTSASTVAKGDKLYIRGTAEGNPTQGVAIWVLGKNYWNGAKVNNNAVVTETVNDDGSFEYEMGSGDTRNMASGQYFVVVQHPMYNGQFDVWTVAAPAGSPYQNSIWVGLVDRSSASNTFDIWGDGKLQGSDAAEALIDAINSPDIDDTYTKLTFLIEEPWIRINSIGDHYVGDQFTITGTTNLAVGDDLIVEVTSSSFQPTQKTQSGEFSGVSETVKVVEGDSYNEWSMDVDASTFKPDEYIVNVEAIEATATATTTFNVLKGVAPTTSPDTPTGAPTTAPTTGPTTVPTPEPTASPGFGAFVALIGLGAVAALVMRKD